MTHRRILRQHPTYVDSPFSNAARGGRVGRDRLRAAVVEVGYGGGLGPVG